MTYHVIDRKHLENLGIDLSPDAFTDVCVGPVHTIAQTLVERHGRKVIDDRQSGYLKNVTDTDILLGVRVVLRRRGQPFNSETDVIYHPYVFDVNISDDGWELDGVGAALANHSNEIGKVVQPTGVQSHGWMMHTYKEFAKPIQMLTLNKIVYIA
jgi:hypothetical protein